MVHSYATLSALEAQLITGDTTPDATLTANRENLMAFARRVTSRIDAITHDTFVPLRQTRYFDCAGEHLDAWTRTIYLGASLGEVFTLTDGASTALVYNTDWRYYPRGHQSTQLLEGLTDSTWVTYSDNWRQAIAIDGAWCYRTRYDVVGWIASGDTVQNVTSISASSTSLTVTDPEGANGWGLAPRFDVGQVIRIGTEYMAITAIDTDDNILTVVRGYNGTTASIHLNGASISTFNVQEDIVRACSLIVAFNYANRGRFERVRWDGINATETIEMPEEAVEILRRYTIADAHGVYGGE